MLRPLLQVIGITRLVGTAKLRLEQKADAALGQVKRVAVAAALAVAAVIFTTLALLAGLVLLFAWLEPEYGAITALATIAGSLVGITLLLVLAAALVGRNRSASARTDRDEELAEWAREKEMASYDADRAPDALAPLAGVAAPNSLTELFRPDPTRPRANTDLLALLQSGDRRTTLAVIGALFAVGWLLGRTLPAAEARALRR
jgi:hypothetical protein